MSSGSLLEQGTELALLWSDERTSGQSWLRRAWERFACFFNSKWRVHTCTYVGGVDWFIVATDRVGRLVMVRGSCTVWHHVRSGNMVQSYELTDALFAAWQKSKWAQEGNGDA